MTTQNLINPDPTPYIKGVTGVILAGGKSSRFGRNKAFAELGGIQLIKRVIAVMGSIFKEVIIIANDPEEYLSLGMPLYEDTIRGLGPLGGVYTGLEKIPGKLGFFVACDMPFLNLNLIRYITDQDGEFDAIVPKIDWKMEPLHALYSKSCLPTIRSLIESGDCMINRFFRTINVRFINEEEIRKHDPDLMSFFNINRPSELTEAEERGSIPR